MRRRTLLFASAAVAASYFALRSRGDASRPTAAAASRDARFTAGGAAAQGLVPRAHYHLAYELQVTVPGQAPTNLHADGEWITTPRADGRTEVRFTPATLDGRELPRAEDLDATAQLVHERGVLTAIGFPDAMPRQARKLLTGLATTFQLTGRSDASWTIAEEDLTGRYDAAYRRSGDQLERSRARYTALRAAEGLSPSADGVRPTEHTTFRVDADGIATAAVELDVSFALGDGMAPVQLVLHASLDRTSIERVVPPGGDAFAAAPIASYADFEGARRNADLSLVNGASMADLLVELKQAAAIAGKEGGNARAQVMARLAALIRLDPEVAEEVAQHVRDHAGELAETKVLLGALASTRIAAGTNALAGLMGDELPDPARAAVVGALSFSNPPTADSLKALSAGIEQPSGDQSALGLGTHGRKARAQDPAGADAATDLLLQHHARAATDNERRLYLEALGNNGALRALPILRTAITGDNRKLSSAAAFSLRYVPGAEVDTLLEQSISRPEVALAAIRAAGYRDPAHWRSLLIAAQEQYAGNDGIQGEIRAILRRWK